MEQDGVFWNSVVLFGFLFVVLAVLELLYLHSPTPATASATTPVASLKLSCPDAKNVHRAANKPVIWDWVCSSVLGHLLSVHRALGSIPCTVISKTNKK